MLISHRGADVAMPHRIHDDFQIFGGFVYEGSVSMPRAVKNDGQRQPCGLPRLSELLGDSCEMTSPTAS